MDDMISEQGSGYSAIWSKFNADLAAWSALISSDANMAGDYSTVVPM